MKMTKTMTLALAFSVLAASLPAVADRDDRHYGGRHDGRNVWHGDIRHFHQGDIHVWRGGHWTHGYHDGHYGWWWVVPTLGLWYWYAAPVYPYPDPYTPPVVTVPSAPSAPPPAAYWYYCDASKTYYPYVQSCPGGWKMVPATPAQ